MIDRPSSPTEAALPPVQSEQRFPPWSLGDIVICVLGGLLLGFIAVFLTFVLLNGIEPSDPVLYMISGTEIYVMVAVVTWLRVGKGRGATLQDIGFRPVKPGFLVLMIPLTVALLISSGIIAELTANVFGDVPDAGDQLGVTSAGLSVTDLVCLLIVAAVVAPVVEEMIFRGLLYQLIRVRKGVSPAIIISALAFAVIHFIPLLLGVFIVMGVAFALVVERSKSLYPAILLHALNNATSVVLVYVTID